MLLMVYLPLETEEVTSVPLTVSEDNLYPLVGVKVSVADEPWFTVNVFVVFFVEVLLYVTVPLPVAFTDNVYVICVNVATTFVLAVMLLMVYLPLETEEVTFVPLTVSEDNLYPLLGEMVRVAAVPSVTVNDFVVFVMAVPLNVTEPPLPDWMESVKVVAGICSNVATTFVLAVILLMVYLPLETEEVTFVPLTVSDASLYPVSGEMVMVAEEPWFTVNVFVVFFVEVLLYVTVPLPVAFTDNVYVICVNVATTFVLAVMLLMVYLPLETEEVTFVPLTVSEDNLYPLLGEMVRVAAVPSVTVNDFVVFVMAVPLNVTEPPLPDWMESVKVVAGICSNVATTFVLAVILLMVYLPLETEEVTFVPLTVSEDNLYPLLGEMVSVAAVPSVTVNDFVVFVTAVPLKVTEPPLPDWMDNVCSIVVAE